MATTNELLNEKSVTFVSAGSEISGNLSLAGVSRIHGRIRGELNGQPGSTIIIGESAVVEARVSGDVILIEGMVTGRVDAKVRVKVGQLGRVIGDIHAPLLEIETGAFFEGSAVTQARLTAAT